MNHLVNKTVQTLLNSKLSELETHLASDFLSYTGPLLNGTDNLFLKVIEELAVHPDKKDKLTIMLTTAGGSAEVVERCVNIIRQHYDEVDFIVPDYAFSAGTIFCMSGDNIHMDYYSVLGPIDPQVQNKEGKLVAALGYLDKINELHVKGANGTITQAEFLILKDFDLAEIRGYEQAKELTITLLKNWLVQYKFKNWDTHRTNPVLLGQEVTPAEKQERAEEIASQLSNNNKWQSHARPINIETLKILRLQIEDYSGNINRKNLIRSYYELLIDYVSGNKFANFVHTRNYI